MKTKTYRNMTDVEARKAVRAICEQCERFTTDDEANNEVKRLMQDELGYEGLTPAVTSISSGAMTMRMFMVMFTSPSGETIQV